MAAVAEVRLDLGDGRVFDVTLGNVISDGGEGRVHAIAGLDKYCAKIYRRPEEQPRLEERLAVLTRFGLGGWHVDGHPELAYPVGLCRDETGRCIGFAMHKLSWPPRTPMNKVLQPSMPFRRNGFLTWDHCVHLAADLARVVGKLHEAGVVVGDLCPDNVFVSLTDGRITLVDVDSFQVLSPDGTRHPTRVLRGDYGAPELAGRPTGTWRSTSSDLTPLGIVIAQILLDQVHPFSGYPHDGGPPDGGELDEYCIAAGLSWITHPDQVDPPRDAPDAAWILPPPIIRLMTRCFTATAAAPEDRPSPGDWVRELSRLAADIQTCGVNPRHRFRSGAAGCPWCDRAAMIGRDSFPEPARPMPELVPWLTRQADRVDEKQTWSDLVEASERDGIVNGTIAKVVKGGLEIDLGVRGFLPASLVELQGVRDLSPYVGLETPVKIIELDQKRRNVVVSRRAWLEQRREELLGRLRTGQVISGVVTALAKFGAFVDIGGVEGLVHISELAWRKVDSPSDVVRTGQTIKVEVLSVDRPRRQVSLSLKATREDPLLRFARATGIDQIIPVTVAELVADGVRVRLDDDLDAVIAEAEMVEPYASLDKRVPVGSEHLVKVVDIDVEERRIELSLRQADADFVEDEEDFNATLYGMPVEYDADDNYVFPEGFDADSGEWLDGFEKQRAVWEGQFMAARARWEAHGRQVRRNRSLNQSHDRALAALRERLRKGN